MARVFTKYLGVDVAKAATYDDFDPGVDTWVVQENIRVIGAQVGNSCTALLSSGAGYYIEGMAELSQSGLMEKDGAILHARFQCKVGQAAAIEEGPIRCDHAEIMFPPGDYIPVSEGTTLYLSLWVNQVLVAANVWRPWAIIYYLKG